MYMGGERCEYINHGTCNIKYCVFYVKFWRQTLLSSLSRITEGKKAKVPKLTLKMFEEEN